MQNPNTDSLSALLQLYHDRPNISNLYNDLLRLTNNLSATDISKLISLYKKSISLIEDELWRHDLTDQHLNLYQQTFKELENLYVSQHNDTRFKFIVIIPVADRPGHLEACLNSLYVLCKK